MTDEAKRAVRPGCCRGGDCTESTCMRLPDGVTCGDCALFGRCEAIIGVRKSDTICDFHPRKFRRVNSEVTK
jgi:hypothetical protein